MARTLVLTTSGRNNHVIRNASFSRPANSVMWIACLAACWCASFEPTTGTSSITSCFVSAQDVTDPPIDVPTLAPAAAARRRPSLSITEPSWSHEASETDSLSINSASFSASGNASFTKSRHTGTRSESASTSIELPVRPAVVSLVSALVIDGACIAVQQDSSEDRRCRTIVFKMENDGFVYPRQNMAHYQLSLMRPYDGSNREPFGLVPQWPTIGETAAISANVSHLTIVLNPNPGLALSNPSLIQFNFSAFFTLRKQELAEPTSFAISVTPPPSSFAQQTAVGFQAAAGVLSAIMLPLPIDPGLLDVQATVLAAQSVCTQPQARAVGIEGRRVLYPTIEATSVDELGDGLWHSLVMVVCFVALHLLVVYAVMQRYESPPAPAAAKAYFPALTFAACLLLLPGAASASFTLLLTEGSSPLLRMGCILTSALCILAVVFPAARLPVLHRAQARSHYDLLIEFPLVLRYVLPTYSWGPDVLSQSWVVPYGALKPNRVRFAPLHLGVVVFMALVFAVPPSSPQGCAAQFFFAMAAVAGQCVVLVLFRPFRSMFHTAASFVTSASQLLPLGLSFAHCFRLTDNTGEGVAGLYTVVHGLVVVRLLATGIAHALELFLIRPTIWPDAGEGMVNTRSIAPPPKRRGAENIDDDAATSMGVPMLERSSAGPLTSKDDGNNSKSAGDEAGDPWQDEELLQHAASIRAIEQRAIEEEVARENLRNLSEEERASRLVFGEPDPLPVRPAPREANAAQRVHTSAEAQRLRRELVGEPLLHVHGLRGPAPPAIVRHLAREYDRL